MSDQPHPSGYEFSALENKVIGKLGRQMAIVGIVLAGFGGVSLALSVLGMVVSRGQGAASIMPGLVLLLMGIWTHRAARGLKRVVNTSGSDIQHLMRAFEELSKLYQVLHGLAWTGIVLVGLIMALFLFGVLR